MATGASLSAYLARVSEMAAKRKQEPPPTPAEQKKQRNDEPMQKRIVAPLAPAFKPQKGFVLQQAAEHAVRAPIKVSLEELNEDQRRAFDLVKEGKSIYILGSAGTGKTRVIKAIHQYLGDAHTHFTALTGIAASNLDMDASTLHKWAGVIPNQHRSAADVLKDLEHSHHKLRIMQSARRLIIDEISMASPELFEMIDDVLRAVRNSPDTPFGGIQVVLCGDFAQLPPVSKREPGHSVQKKNKARMLFQSPRWKSWVPTGIEFTKVIRQKGDTEFIRMLTEFRNGMMSKETIATFCELERVPESFRDIEPTCIVSTNHEADRINRQKYDSLDGPSFTYVAEDYGTDNHAWPAFEGSILARKEISLKVGMPVMLIKNINPMLVNGLRGYVVGFQGRKPLVKFVKYKNPIVVFEEPFEFKRNRRVICSRSQVPLIHAAAITVHKSQGLTITHVLVDLRRTFEAGQAYVALTRAESREHLQVIGFKEEHATMNPDVREFYRKLAEEREKAENKENAAKCALAPPTGFDDNDFLDDDDLFGDFGEF